MYYTKIRAQKHLFFFPSLVTLKRRDFSNICPSSWTSDTRIHTNYSHPHWLLPASSVRFSFGFHFFLSLFFFFFLPSSLCSLDTSCKTRFYYTRYITGKISTLLLAIEKKMPDWRRKKISEKKNPTLTFKLKIKIRTYFFSCLAERDVLACFGERKTILFFVSPC